MWTTLLVRSLLQVSDRHLHTVVRRTFLSQHFACKDEWDKRLDAPLFKKIVLEDYYNEIANKFAQTKKMSALDVDLFSNAVSKSSFLDEIHDLVHKLRISENAVDILPSTHHSFVRAHIDLGKQDDLLKILNDRINYGIFLDDYCSLLMMNDFIEKQNYRDAAKIAVLLMLQEDFSNVLLLYLSLYACHKYLLDPSEWEPPVEQVEEDAEEIRVRVKFLRNPFFDEHFDLKEATHLIGKTFITIRHFLNNDLTSSYNVLGAILFDKYPMAETLLQQLEKNKFPVHQDIASIALKHLAKKKESDNTITEAVCKLIGYLENNKGTSLALPELELKLIEEVQRCEPELIKQQKETYQQWIENRDKLIVEAHKKSIRDKKLDELERRRMEMAKKEEELFFFENEDDIELKIENKKVIYPRKWFGKKKKKRTETSEYVSPETW